MASMKRSWETTENPMWTIHIPTGRSPKCLTSAWYWNVTDSKTHFRNHSQCKKQTIACISVQLLMVKFIKTIYGKSDPYKDYHEEKGHNSEWFSQLVLAK